MNLSERMKSYENAFDYKLPNRVPKVIRLDGRAFHTLLRDYSSFNTVVHDTMCGIGVEILKELGSIGRFAYIQSDECSIAINDHISQVSEPWFENRILKICSVTSSLASLEFHRNTGLYGCFDSRLFILPDMQELYNYFLWRQYDAIRNSISTYARLYYTQAELNKKSSKDMQEMMFKKGFNWNNAPPWTKIGTFIFNREKVIVDLVKNKDVLAQNFLGG